MEVWPQAHRPATYATIALQSSSGHPRLSLAPSPDLDATEFHCVSDMREPFALRATEVKSVFAPGVVPQFAGASARSMTASIVARNALLHAPVMRTRCPLPGDVASQYGATNPVASCG